ncbi:MAG: AAA family ATPase, partial [Actinomycetota bacterium]|nr:AAA family ATPase [Actinomycetota bacterium]
MDGRSIALGGNRQRAILGYLALHAGRTVAIDAIVDDVWGDEPPATVVKSLSTLVSRLRASLGPAGIELLHDGSGYRLEVPEDGLDLERFRSHLRAARIAELGGDVVAAASQRRSALATWTGPAFDRLDAPFVASASAALADERDAAADGLVRVLVRVGDHGAAIELLEHLVETSPYREDRWARLVDGHLQAGSRADARAAYDRAVKVLDHDLGLVPGEQLLAAARRIDLVDPVTAEPSPPPIRTVGRKAELDRLEAAVRSAVAGDRRVLVVVGEAGVGKSHLLRALAERLGERGLPVLIGRCDPLGANALSPLLQVIAHAEQLGVLPDVSFDGYPAVRSALDGGLYGDHRASTDRIDAGDLHRRRILVELAELAQLVGRDHPRIIGLEDLHWADPFTLTVVHHLANLEATANTCLIATARPHELDQSRAGELLNLLASTVPVERIDLQPLTGPEVRELVAGALPPAARVPAVFDAINAGSGGNPLYALHLARHVSDRGAMALDGPLPADTLQLFEARLCTVSDAARELLAVGATMGDEFSLDHLLRVFGEPAIPLIKTVNELSHAGLIEPVDRSGGSYRFVHGMIRRAAYEGVTDRTRQAELHRTVAVLLGYGQRPPTLEVAEHLWRARSVVPHDDVALAILEAVQPALGFGAVTAAGDLLRQGLCLDASPARLAALHVRLGA